MKECIKTWIVHGLRVFMLTCLLQAFPAIVSAGEVRDLYRADIPVQGQTRAERNSAIRTALQQVLTRVTGRRDFNDNEFIREALNAPLRFVQQFRYRRMDPPRVVITDDGLEETYIEWLRLDFDEQSVNALLRQAGLPLWGKARPSILMWVAVEDRNQRNIISGSLPGSERETLEAAATERGIPILIPLMDLQDQTSLHFADLWGDFQDAIRRASERYQPGGILVGRVYSHADGQWQGRWTLYLGDGRYHWTLDGSTQAAVMTAGINEMADKLGQQFAQVEGQDTRDRVEVVVSDIQSLAQYARAAGYLASLDVVDGVQATEVGQNQVAFMLYLRGQIQSFRQATVYGETLVVDDSRLAQAPPPADAPPPPVSGSMPATDMPTTDMSTTDLPTADIPPTASGVTTLYYRLLP